MKEFPKATAVQMAEADKDGVMAAAMRSARKMVECSEPGSELVGYFSIGVYSDGQTIRGWHQPGSHQIISQAIFRAIVREAVEDMK